MLDCREVRTDFNCDSCYEITLEDCDVIIIDGALEPESIYYLNIYDQFDIKRIIQIETDDSGAFEINKTLLPDNYFNPFGNYDMYVSSDEEGEDRVTLTFEEIDYTCIILIIE